MSPARGAEWRAALGILGAVLGCALFADMLASELPWWLRLEGRTWVLPNLTRPAELRGETIQTLAARVQSERGDFLFGPLIPYGPHQTGRSRQEGPPPWPPSREHWLGTDEVGRDVLARLIHGARASLWVAGLAVLWFVSLGWLLGALAGYYRGWVDGLVSRLIEVCSSFPALFLLIAIVGLLRWNSTLPLIAVLALTKWTEVARLVRGEVLRLRSQPFVQASRALGASDARVLLAHILPHTQGPVMVAATLGLASTILLESAMSFLGLGIPPPTPSWGELLLQAHRYLVYPGAWWLAVFPGVVLVMTATGWFWLGEALQRRADSVKLKN